MKAKLAIQSFESGKKNSIDAARTLNQQFPPDLDDEVTGALQEILQSKFYTAWCKSVLRLDSIYKMNTAVINSTCISSVHDLYELCIRTSKIKTPKAKFLQTFLRARIFSFMFGSDDFNIETFNPSCAPEIYAQAIKLHNSLYGVTNMIMYLADFLIRSSSVLSSDFTRRRLHFLSLYAHTVTLDDLHLEFESTHHQLLYLYIVGSKDGFSRYDARDIDKLSKDLAHSIECCESSFSPFNMQITLHLLSFICSHSKLSVSRCLSKFSIHYEGLTLEDGRNLIPYSNPARTVIHHQLVISALLAAYKHELADVNSCLTSIFDHVLLCYHYCDVFIWQADIINELACCVYVISTHARDLFERHCQQRLVSEVNFIPWLVCIFSFSSVPLSEETITHLTDNRDSFDKMLPYLPPRFHIDRDNLLKYYQGLLDGCAGMQRYFSA